MSDFRTIGDVALEVALRAGMLAADRCEDEEQGRRIREATLERLSARPSARARLRRNGDV
jgi:hypothetical protein